MAVNIMDWFNMGAASAPMAGLGNAIRGVLAQHTKLSELAGGKAFEAQMPENQARANYYQSLAQPEGSFSMQELQGNPPQVTEAGGQKFYNKPVTSRGKVTGYQWAPVNPGLMGLFGGGMNAGPSPTIPGAPVAQRQYANNGAVRAYSDDGGMTWYDEKTNQRIQ